MLPGRILLAAALVVPSAWAGWKLPWRKAPDPRVETTVWRQAEALDLSGRRVALYPVTADTQVEPAPPSLAEPLAHALTAEAQAADVAVAGAWPWDDRPDREKKALAEEDKLALLIETAREGGFDGAVVGRIEKFYRRAAGGLHVEVSLLLLEVGGREGEPAAEPRALWNGRKTFEWRGYLPADACFGVIASEFAREWAPPKKPPTNQAPAAPPEAISDEAPASPQS